MSHVYHFLGLFQMPCSSVPGADTVCVCVFVLKKHLRCRMPNSAHRSEDTNIFGFPFLWVRNPNPL